jgi:hypothetical protein
MSSPGFFYSAEDQARAQNLARQQAYAQALMNQDPGNAQYGGLRAAGNSILGAFLSKRADTQALENAKNSQDQHVRSIAAYLRGNGSPSQSPQISTAAGTAPQVNQEAQPGMEGPTSAQNGTPAPAQPVQPQQGMGGDQASRLLATNDPWLIQQFAPQLIQNQMNRDNTLWERGLPMTQAARDQAELQGQIARGNAQFTNQLPMTAAQQAADRRAAAQLAESGRHNRVEEEVARNPFGVGPTGAAMAAGKTGDEFLSTLPPGLAAQIKAVGTYRQPAPAGRTSPTGIKFMSLVNQAYPSFDASQYGAKTKARNDFTTGKNGNTVRSLNVAVQHLDQLGQLSDAMANGNVQLVNRVGNFIASQTGNPAPTNFNAAKQLVGDEIVKAIVGAGGGVSDREEAAHNISSASSPAQLAGVIRTYQGLLSGQLVGLRQQYQKSTGLDDFEDFLAPETRAKLEAHGAASGAAPPPSGGGGQITPEQAAAELARRRANRK